MPVHTYVATNTSTEPVGVHTDEGARRLGFRGGLVPGPNVFANIVEALRDHVGEPWLLGGHADIRYRRPVFDGDEVAVVVSPDAEDPPHGSVAVNSGERRCATGTYAAAISDRYSGSRPPLRPQAPWPTRKHATDAALLEVEDLGSVTLDATRQAYQKWFSQLDLEPEPYETRGIVPPSFLVRSVETLVRANFEIMTGGFHTGTELQVTRPVREGEKLSVRGRVDRVFRRRGHHFFTWEIGWFDETDKPVLWTLHTVLYWMQTPTT